MQQFKPFTVDNQMSSSADQIQRIAYTIAVQKDPFEIKTKLMGEVSFLADGDVHILPSRKQLRITARRVNWPTLAQAILAADPSTAGVVREIIKNTFGEIDKNGGLVKPQTAVPLAAPLLNKGASGSVGDSTSPRPLQGLKSNWPWLLGGAVLGAGALWLVNKLKKPKSQQGVGSKFGGNSVTNELERRKKLIQKRRMDLANGRRPKDDDDGDDSSSRLEED